MQYQPHLSALVVITSLNYGFKESSAFPHPRIEGLSEERGQAF